MPTSEPSSQAEHTSFFGFFARYFGGSKQAPTVQPKPVRMQVAAPTKKIVLKNLTVDLAATEKKLSASVKRHKHRTHRHKKKVPSSRSAAPVQDKALVHYMQRKSAYHTFAKKNPGAASAPIAPVKNETKSPGMFGSALNMLPFFSQKLDETTQKTAELSEKIVDTERKTQEMAKRLHETELELQKSLAKLAPKVAPQETSASAAVDTDEQGLGKLLSVDAAEDKEIHLDDFLDTPDGTTGRFVKQKKDEPMERSSKVVNITGLKKKEAQEFISLINELPQDNPGFLASLAAAIREIRADWKDGSPATASKLQKEVPKDIKELAALVDMKLEAKKKGMILSGAPEGDSAAKVPSAESVAALGSLVSSMKKEENKGTITGIPDIKEVKKQNEKKKKEEIIMPTVVKKKQSNSALGEFIGSIKYFGMGKERQAFVQNLATMLNAGLPLIDALHTLQMETRVKPAKKLIQRVIDAVENGSALWRAMEAQHFFSPHAIALIRIGEEAGNLAENMQYLAAQQEKDAALKGKVRMAMIYPAIVMTLMFIIVMGLGMFVLPNLIQVLFSLNVELPLATRLVIMFTNAFTEYGAVFIPSMLVGVVILTILGKFTRFKVVVQWVIFRIPGIGKLARMATLARFGVILGGLLQAGVPLVEAIHSMAEVTPTVAYKNFYIKLLDHISVGDSFGKSFAVIRGSEKILPIQVQQLIITGERTGTLAKIMLKIADIYEKEANSTAEKLPVILEPMLLLFIGGLVGTIAFAIIVPIYSIVGNVGG